MLALKRPLFTSLLTLVAIQASAATLRCENGIADKGDTTSEVLQKCGTPVSQAFTGYAVYRGGKEKYEKEEWVYGPSEGGMLYFVQFEGGRLMRVDSKRGS
jgi:hypothetical protein